MPPETSRLRNGNCPCLSGEQYDDCCGRFHRGDAEAPTAEQLMRSRYSAFVVLDSAYLLRTWHPDTRPPELELDPDVEWRRLDIVSARRGGPLDSEGTVEFKAYFRQGGSSQGGSSQGGATQGGSSKGGATQAGERGVHHETSRFLRVDRRWYYLDAELIR